ncbi:MAG TPA: biotin transporter BioY [Gammaproteobacteria bacterium]|nr:biotin transporter BioY [Gammaproteobacteria bacterium]
MLYKSSVSNSILSVTFLFSLSLLLLSNYCRIPIPGIAAPITLQTLCIITTSLLLPQHIASKTMVSYFLLTLTIFNPHGAFVIPTSIGYIMGMAMAAYLGIQFRGVMNMPKLILIQYCLPLAMGSLVLSTSMGLSKAFFIGFYPFIFVEVLKALLTHQVLCFLKHK